MDGVDLGGALSEAGTDQGPGLDRVARRVDSRKGAEIHPLPCGGRIARTPLHCKLRSTVVPDEISRSRCKLRYLTWQRIVPKLSVYRILYHGNVRRRKKKHPSIYLHAHPKVHTQSRLNAYLPLSLSIHFIDGCPMYFSTCRAPHALISWATLAFLISMCCLHDHHVFSNKHGVVKEL